MQYKFDDSLGRLTKIVTTGLGNILEKKFINIGYHYSADQWTILAYLYRYKNLNQKQLAEATGKNKVAIKRIIDSLEREKLVSRLTDKKDNRYNRVSLSGKGEKIYIKLAEQAGDAIKEAFEDISKENMEICIKVLHHVSGNLEKTIACIQQNYPN